MEIRNVLVTGGAGFFGRAFARYVLERDMVERLCIFSRGEHSQADMREKLGDDPRLRFFVGDIRDIDRLTRAMQGVDLVVHAAALKRVEVGRYNPEEMVKTNILGALNLVAAARVAHVDRVVALSTDKAFQPCSAYGTSKAMMEQVVLAANENSGASGPKFVVTRYGNVFGSSGSILPKWWAMIQAGATRVPVSDPECTRFLMTMEEAVDLVIGAAAHIAPGKIAVPKLPAYRVGDLAEALDVEMNVIGLPIWEKRHESMEADNCSQTAPRLSVSDLAGHINTWIARGTGGTSPDLREVFKHAS